MCKQVISLKETHIRNKSASENPPFDTAALDQALGKIVDVEYLCPGVYFVTAMSKTSPKLGVDYYIVAKDSPAISDAGKAYGKAISGCLELLAYRFDDEHSGRFVVEYEAYRFLKNSHMPLPKGETLRETALYGTELNPEFFGMYPVPAMTPWGYTLRHKTIHNGVYWLEPEECGWVLGVHSLLTSDLTEKTKRLGKHTDDGEQDTNPMGYIFFDCESSALVLRELADFHPGLLPR